MPNRERNGAVIRPARVVAPISVKWLQRKRMNARAGSLADDQIDAKILHRGIQNLFHSRLQAMNFVEKENFLGFKRRENRGEIAFALEQRASAGFDRNVKFVGDDLRQRRLAESRRTVKQNVIERFAAAARGFDGNLNVFFYRASDRCIR